MLQYYIVDAFTDERFKGNPAGVCLLEQGWPDDGLMQNIAAENNLAETAFIIKQANDYGLRWFTPETEMDLCGHATLASAFVLFKEVDKSADELRFHTKSGLLTVIKRGELLEMNFPSRKPIQTEVTAKMSQALGVTVLEAHLSRDLLMLLENERQVKEVVPDIDLLKALPDAMAVIVTAKGDTADFVSRFFAPGVGVAEDPVTGSAHATLIPFWSERLGKKVMTARQLSKRGGTLYCEDCGERVKISGRAVLYLKGEIMV